MSKAFEQCARAHAGLAWVASGTLLVAACGGGAMDPQVGAFVQNTAGSSPTAAAGSKAPSTPPAAGTPGTAAVASGGGGAGAKAETATGGVAGARAAGSPAAAAGGMSGSAGSAAPSEPTFTNVYNALFSVAGIGGCYGCHGGLANPALNGNLAMLSDQATTYKALVSAMSSEASVCKGMTRVTPGDPMKSLLYLKLSGKQPCGMPMPPGTPVSPDIVGLIEKWIVAGAKED